MRCSCPRGQGHCAPASPSKREGEDHAGLECGAELTSRPTLWRPLTGVRLREAPAIGGRRRWKASPGDISRGDRPATASDRHRTYHALVGSRAGHRPGTWDAIARSGFAMSFVIFPQMRTYRGTGPDISRQMQFNFDFTATGSSTTLLFEFEEDPASRPRRAPFWAGRCRGGPVRRLPGVGGGTAARPINTGTGPGHPKTPNPFLPDLPPKRGPDPRLLQALFAAHRVLPDWLGASPMPAGRRAKAAVRLSRHRGTRRPGASRRPAAPPGPPGERNSGARPGLIEMGSGIPRLKPAQR
jgi:hypothetical protein